MNLTDRLITRDDLMGEGSTRNNILRKTLAYFTGKWWRAFIWLSILFLVIFVADVLIMEPRSASVTMTLNYELASEGLTPNGTRFNMYEIRTEPVLQTLIHYAGLEGRITTDVLADCITMEATHESGYDSENGFISTAYRINFVDPGNLRERNAKDMLTLLCKAYREYFYENYVVCRTSAGQSMDDLDISTEYLTRADIAMLKLEQIERYASERASQSGDFRDPDSGLSFSDIELRAHNLWQYELTNARSYVILNAVSEDAGILRDQLLYRERMEKIKYDKSMASYRVNNEGVALYNKAMTSIFMVPVINEKSQIYMSMAMTGMDNMVKKADNDLNDAIGTYKLMEADQTIADGVVAKPYNKAQWEKTESMMQKLDEDIRDLFQDLAVTDKAFESTRVRRYMMFTESSSSHSRSRALVEAAVLTLFIAAAGFVSLYLAISRTERGGQRR